MTTTILSAHLDDAVFSAYGVVAGATVVTIFAGIPPGGTAPTMFDSRAGFASGTDAMRARRKEDHAAAELAGFTAVHLGCLDTAYRGCIGANAVAAALETVDIEGPVYAPLGLHHPDHVAVSTAARRLYTDLWLYEDLPYTYMFPSERAAALTAATFGDTVTCEPSGDKEAAVRMYRSQINDTTHMVEILSPERYHRFVG